jgi:hypothetical protein
MAFRYGELKFDYGDLITLNDGEVGVVTGFMGRGRNRVMVRLPPAENGNKRMRVIDATDVIKLVKKTSQENEGGP